MAEQAKFYEVYLDSADSDETSKEKIQKQYGHISVFEDNFALGYTIHDSKISLALYGTFIEGVGMMLSTRNFYYDFSAERRFQTFSNPNDSENWHGDVFKCDNGDVVCYDKKARTKAVEVLSQENQNIITENIGAILDYVQKNSPETWAVICNTLNGFGNSENIKYINKMKPVYNSKEIPEIFKQSQPGDH